MNFGQALVALKYHAECLNPFQSELLVKKAPHGLHFRIHKRDAVGRGIYKHGAHEPVLTEWIGARFAKPGTARHFVDIGANIGYFTCIFSKLAGPQGSVMSFEPEPNNHRLLLENIALNGLLNVTAERVALGSKRDTAMLNIYKKSNRGRHSMVESKGASQIQIQVKRLDDALEDAGAADQTFDLMKIDVEGYEPFAVEGATKAMERTRALAMEFSPDLLAKVQVDPEAFLLRTQRAFDSILLVTELGVRPSSVDECLSLGKQIDIVLEKKA